MPLTILQDGSEQIGYQNPAFPVYVKWGDLLRFPGMAALCHWHEELELLMPVSGSLRYNINGSVVEVSQGDAIFVNSRQLHYGFSVDGRDCQYLCLAFLPQLLCVNQEISSRFVLPLVNSPGIPWLLLRGDVPEQRILLDIIREMGTLVREQAPGYELGLTACVYRLWQGLYQLAQTAIGEEVSSDSNVIIQKKMMDYVRSHYQERIRGEDIAAAGGVCRTKCWQIFRKYLGQTPNDYLNSIRLERAMQLLKSTRLSVTEIASECGFSGASYFTELFTRQKGCPPSRYRKA